MDETDRMDVMDGIDTVVTPDAVTYDETYEDYASEAAYEGIVEESVNVASDETGKGWLSQLMSLETLLTDKLMSGNILAICMAVIIASILVYFLYKIVSRQSGRDRAKDSKKKLKQQKNQKDSKEIKKNV